jgi:hypothetical protein
MLPRLHDPDAPGRSGPRRYHHWTAQDSEVVSLDDIKL